MRLDFRQFAERVDKMINPFSPFGTGGGIVPVQHDPHPAIAHLEEAIRSLNELGAPGLQDVLSHVQRAKIAIGKGNPHYNMVELVEQDIQKQIMESTPQKSAVDIQHTLHILKVAIDYIKKAA
jgi:hypothetical protein